MFKTPTCFFVMPEFLFFFGLAGRSIENRRSPAVLLALVSAYAPVCFCDTDGRFQGITMDYARHMEANEAKLISLI